MSIFDEILRLLIAGEKDEVQDIEVDQGALCKLYLRT